MSNIVLKIDSTGTAKTDWTGIDFISGQTTTFMQYIISPTSVEDAYTILLRERVNALNNLVTITLDLRNDFYQCTIE